MADAVGKTENASDVNNIRLGRYDTLHNIPESSGDLQFRPAAEREAPAEET